VADVLFGDVSPAGKLPVTFPRSLDQLPAFEDYSMIGRTYRYMSEEPLYPFGFGLSYSCFEYSDLQLDKTELALGDSLNISVTLSNGGGRDSGEVVQFYLSDLQASTIVPLHHLVGFERVLLKAGESCNLRFTMTPEMMSFYNEDGKLTLEPGEFRLEVGGCSPGQRAQDLGAPTPVTAVFQVNHSTIDDRP
jgi:beta-glucosidase